MTAANNLRGVDLVLTAACNLSCSYCYQSDKKNRRAEWPVVQASLDRLLASTRSEVELLFIGGEPLMEFPTIERAVAYLTAHKRSDLRIRYAVITNGLLLGERQAEFFVEHDFGVKLSFDGVPPAQNLRGNHTFNPLDGLLDRLRSRYPRFYTFSLRVSLTLTPATLRWLPQSVEYFVLAKRVHDLRISPAFTGVADWKPERIHELDDAFKRVFAICLERYKYTEDVPLNVFRNTGESPAAERDDVPMCRMGADYLDSVAVDVDGQAHGCLTFVESYQTFPTKFLKSRVEAMRLGDIRAPTFNNRLEAFPEIARSAEIFNRKELKYSSYGQCGECKYLQGCGVCPMSMGRVEGDDDPRKVPDFLCAYNLVSLKYRERFPRVRSLAERLAGPAQISSDDPLTKIDASIGAPPASAELREHRSLNQA
jgi:uncharacterized protein